MRILLFLIFSTNLFATSVSCDHEQICNFLKSSLKQRKIALKVVMLNDKIEISKADFFVSPPHYLSPKTSDLVKLREDLSKKTFRIFLPSNMIKKYKTNSSNPVEATSHFWLYPDIHCFIQNRFYEALAQHNIYAKEIEELDCSRAAKKIRDFKRTLAKLRPVSFISNDVELAPLFHMKNVEFLKSKKGAKFKSVKLPTDQNKFELFDKINTFLKSL